MNICYNGVMFINKFKINGDMFSIKMCCIVGNNMFF